jgi:eukaryotic-like serine/threonine-protein kinase
MSVKPATRYEPGYVIAGKYELESLLGQGGMGAVWKARNAALESSVAIKVVRTTGDKELLHGRLLQEARAAAKLQHPAIVKVFDVGETEGGDPFIVMELLEGDSLGTILEAEKRLTSVQAARLLLPICDALWLAHEKGIVHRDLKPDNVFVVQHEGTIQPKLVDFGIVKLQESAGESHLTKAGDVLGSPDYMSPEQARGLEDVGHLTDVWSFSVVLYEAVTGRTPFKGSNYNALLRQIVEDTPPTLQQLSAGDAELSALVARGLSKNPQERPASMGEFGRALATWLIKQGVTEDICGTTLETKWLRGTDGAGGRARPTFASIADAWPTAERGSGVRRNPGEGINTLRPPAGTDPPPVLLIEDAPAQLKPNRGPMRWVMGGIGALLTVAGIWFAVGPGDQAKSAMPSAVPAAPSPPSSPAPAAVESQVEPTTETSAAAALEAPAQTSPEPVSSPAGRARDAVAPRAKPAPRPATKVGGSSGKAKAKPDLMSPY